MILRQNFDQTGEKLLELADLAVADLRGPVRRILPVGRRVKLAFAFRNHIAITAKAVKSLPVLPSGFLNEVVWV